MSDLFSLGFRILGPTHGERRVVDWERAFDAYAACGERAHVDKEGYLSLFTFDGSFRDHLKQNGTTRAYDGPCFARWLPFDIDRENDLESARRDAAALCLHLAKAFGVSDDAMLVFYSGAKGFHVGISTAQWSPKPGPVFSQTARRFVENIARAVPDGGIAIDTGIYDKVHAFRAANSRHPRTGLHKREFGVDELLHLSATRILELAARPRPFEVPDVQGSSPELSAAWDEAAEQMRLEAEAHAERLAAIANGNAAPTLNRLTLDFIREGAAVGERHRRLYSAACNLGEFNCPPALAHALLTEPACDCGLRPSDVGRQIDCGLADAAKPPEAADGNREASE